MEPIDREEFYFAFFLSSAIWLGTFTVLWAVFP